MIAGSAVARARIAGVSGLPIITPPPPPPPPPPPGQAITPPIHWMWVGGPDSQHDYEISFANNRQMIFRRKGPATVEWTMDGRHPSTSLVTELSDQLKIYRNHELFFRGIIDISDDEVGMTHEVRMQAADFRAKLDHRLIKPYMELGYYSEDVSEVFSNLIALIQGEPGGNEGIIIQPVGRAVGSSTEVPIQDFGLELGESIAGALDRLGEHETAGFDWGIDPDMTFRVWHPYRGVARSEPLDFGGAIWKATRSLKGRNFGNYVLGMGQGFLVPEEVETVDIVTDPRGKWEIAQGWPNIDIQEQQQGRTEYLLEEVSTREYTYELELKHGWWNPDRLWLGDDIPIFIRSGRINVDEIKIVEEVSISLDESGVETVKVTVE